MSSKSGLDNNSENVYNEYVLLAYFDGKSKTNNSASLWSLFSMLKATLNIKHNTRIESYAKLTAFFKRKKNDYVPRKSKSLEIEDIEKSITHAPDEDCLLMKVGTYIT